MSSQKSISDEISSNNPKEENIGFLEVLKIFSPGTAIRSALDDLLKAGMGALIVIEKEGLSNIVDGGFRVNSRFSPQKLVELAKMDGAIVLSEDLKKILQANTLLVPSSEFSTKETGTRHKAAERTAQHMGTTVIAVSERKNKITLYWKDKNYVLDETSELLRKAAETLQVLEKQKESFHEMLLHLNILEITDYVTRTEVCDILQKIEIIERITERVKRYLVELGKEGIIVSMRLRELTKDLSREKNFILKDYFGVNHQSIDSLLSNMNFDFLLENSNVLRILFEDTVDSSITSKGRRILGRLNLLEKDLDVVLGFFPSLDQVFDASRESFLSLFKNENFVDSLMKNLDGLRNKIISGKKI